jgi:hypothetical protein
MMHSKATIPSISRRGIDPSHRRHCTFRAPPEPESAHKLHPPTGPRRASNQRSRRRPRSDHRRLNVPAHIRNRFRRHTRHACRTRDACEHASPLAALVGLGRAMSLLGRTPQEIAHSLAFFRFELDDEGFLAHARAGARTSRTRLHDLVRDAVAAGELDCAEPAALARAVRPPLRRARGGFVARQGRPRCARAAKRSHAARRLPDLIGPGETSAGGAVRPGDRVTTRLFVSATGLPSTPSRAGPRARSSGADVGRHSGSTSDAGAPAAGPLLGWSTSSAVQSMW